MSVVFENQTPNRGLEENGHRTQNGQLSASRYLAACKGAPEVIQKLLKKVPPHYEEVYKHYASKGARVIALAYKSLDSKDWTLSMIKGIKRNEVECDLEFAGFAIFRTPLKE